MIDTRSNRARNARRNQATFKQLQRMFYDIRSRGTAPEKIFTCIILVGIILLVFSAVLSATRALLSGSLVDELSDETPPPLRVGCYNIWNYNSIWNVRKRRIAEIIETEQLDIVGLQEIRIRPGASKNQMEEINEQLPSHLRYEHTLFKEATRLDGGEIEGVAILSRFPIVENSSAQIGAVADSIAKRDGVVGGAGYGNGPGEGPDHLNRTCLRALIDTPGGKLNVFVTHTSFSKRQQCYNSVALKQFITAEKRQSPYPQILMGDLNVYDDYTYPMELLTRRSPSLRNPCRKVIASRQLKSLETVESNAKRVTFRSHQTQVIVNAATTARETRPIYFDLAVETMALAQYDWRASNRPKMQPNDVFSIVKVNPNDDEDTRVFIQRGNARLTSEHDDSLLFFSEAKPSADNGDASQQWRIERLNERKLERLLADTLMTRTRRKLKVESGDFDSDYERDKENTDPTDVSLPRVAVALFAWEPRQDTELSLMVGDVLEVLAFTSDEWWQARLNGRIGFISPMYVQLMDGRVNAFTCPLLSSELLSATESLEDDSSALLAGGRDALMPAVLAHAVEMLRCVKSTALVRIKSVRGSYLHEHIQRNNAEAKATSQLSVGEMHLFDSQIFEMTYHPMVQLSHAEAERIRRLYMFMLKSGKIPHAISEQSSRAIALTFIADALDVGVLDADAAILDEAHRLEDVWTFLNPSDCRDDGGGCEHGNTFSNLPFVDSEHKIASNGPQIRPDWMLVHGSECLVPQSMKTEGDGTHMKIHYFPHILFWRAVRYWFPPEMARDLDFSDTTDNVKLFYEEASPAEIESRWRFLLPFYVFLSVWFAYLAHLRSKYVLLILFLFTAPFWFALYVAYNYGNEDDFKPSDHLALIAEFQWSNNREMCQWGL